MAISALATPNLRSHSLNPVRFEFSESDGSVFKFLVKIYFETYFGSDHYELGAQFVQFPDTNDDIKFDAQEIMRGRVKPAQTGTYGSNPGLQTLSVQRYKYDIISKDIDGTELDTHSETTPQYIYYGGIKWQEWEGAHFFVDWLPSQLSFLTWQPNNQKIDIYQHVYITYLPLETGITLTLKAKWYFSNNTNDEDTITAYAVTSLVPYTFIASMIDWVAPEYDYDDPTIVKYEVWLEVADEPVTEVRTYVIDRAVHRNKKRFVWANTIGGIDSIMCTGNYADEYEYTGSEAIIYVPADYDVVDGQFEPYDFAEQGMPMASTGWKTKDEIDHLRDAILSLALFEDDGKQLLPITIARDTIRILESEQQLYALQWKYKHLWRNKVYTGPGYDNLVRA